MRALFLIFFIFLLTSCASVTQKPQNSLTPSLTWENRVSMLSHLQRWNAQGVIGIRLPHEGASLNWKWQQTPHNYTLNLFGPLGSHAIELNGYPGQVSLETPDGKKLTARNPDDLLKQQLGWQLPVSSLYYWIRGLPVPTLAAQKSFDPFNRLSILVQQNWKIEYLRYVSVNHMDLPTKILLTNSVIQVKIVINQWQI